MWVQTGWENKVSSLPPRSRRSSRCWSGFLQSDEHQQKCVGTWEVRQETDVMRFLSHLKEEFRHEFFIVHVDLHLVRRYVTLLRESQITFTVVVQGTGSSPEWSNPGTGWVRFGGFRMRTGTQVCSPLWV